MLIPVRCFTCGKTISDKWVPFIKGVNEKKDSDKDKQYQRFFFQEALRSLYTSIKFSAADKKIKIISIICFEFK